jgi:hypothetical protein
VQLRRALEVAGALEQLGRLALGAAGEQELVARRAKLPGVLEVVRGLGVAAELRVYGGRARRLLGQQQRARGLAAPARRRRQRARRLARSSS